MNIKQSRSLFGEPVVIITTTLAKGSEFCFIAKWDEEEQAWELSFTINQVFYKEKLGLGETVEATRLLLSIWKRFSKFRCVGGGATESHKQTYLSLGFKDQEDWLFYEPKESV